MAEEPSATEATAPNSFPTKNTLQKVRDRADSTTALCSAAESSPSSSMSPSIAILHFADTLEKLSSAAAMLVGLALYASTMRVLRSVLVICERLFDGTYASIARTASSRETPNCAPTARAAMTLSALYEPTRLVAMIRPVIPTFPPVIPSEVEESPSRIRRKGSSADDGNTSAP